MKIVDENYKPFEYMRSEERTDYKKAWESVGDQIHYHSEFEHMMYHIIRLVERLTETYIKNTGDFNDARRVVSMALTEAKYAGLDKVNEHQYPECFKRN